METGGRRRADEREPWPQSALLLRPARTGPKDIGLSYHDSMLNWQVGLLVLVAVLVGAAIPVLIQLNATLKSARQLMDRSGEQLEQALGALAETLVRVDHMLGALEDGTMKLATALGAVIAPTVGAAVRAWRGSPDDDGAPSTEATKPPERKETGP